MKKERLSDAYRFQGFAPKQIVQDIKGDQGARMIRLKRRQKKQFVLNAAKSAECIMTVRPGLFAIFLAAICEYTLKLKSGEYIANGVRW